VWSHNVTTRLLAMKLIQNLSYTVLSNVFNCSNYVASYGGKASGQLVEGTGSDIHVM
jgi:hypothetical protein